MTKNLIEKGGVRIFITFLMKKGEKFGKFIFWSPKLKLEPHVGCVILLILATFCMTRWPLFMTQFWYNFKSWSTLQWYFLYTNKKWHRYVIPLVVEKLKNARRWICILRNREWTPEHIRNYLFLKKIMDDLQKCPLSIFTKMRSSSPPPPVRAAWFCHFFIGKDIDIIFVLFFGFSQEQPLLWLFFQKKT